MKLIIAGSRTIDFCCEPESIFNMFGFTEYDIDEYIHGGCSTGVDSWADNWYDCKTFPADWEKHGRAAGPIRNKQMAEYGDRLLLIWDGESKGSKNMKENMLKLNKPVYEVILKRHNV